MRKHSRGDVGRDYTRPPFRRMRGGLQPWLLLLLRKKQSHGYELMERLSQDVNMPDADSGFLYRTLRHLEEEGMVESSWDTEGQGPARRLYQVKPEGIKYLNAWAENLRSTRKRLDHFLAEYEKSIGAEEEKPGES